MFAISTLNVLWGMLAGTRYSRDDPELQDLLSRIKENFRSGNPTGGIVALFPILKRIAPGLSGHKKAADNLHELQEFFRVSNGYFILNENIIFKHKNIVNF